MAPKIRICPVSQGAVRRAARKGTSVGVEAGQPLLPTAHLISLQDWASALCSLGPSLLGSQARPLPVAALFELGVTDPKTQIHILVIHEKNQITNK